MVFSPKAWPLWCCFWLLSLFPRLLGKSQLNVYFANFSWHKAEERIRNVLRRRFLCEMKLNVMQRSCVINPSLDEAVFKGGGEGMMVNLSTELLTAALQGFELMIFRSRCRRSHISSAGTYIRRQVFWTSCTVFFFCVDILKSFFEHQMQTYFGGRIQLKRVQARVQLRLYQKVNLRM